MRIQPVTADPLYFKGLQKPVNLQQIVSNVDNIRFGFSSIEKAGWVFTAFVALSALVGVPLANSIGYKNFRQNIQSLESDKLAIKIQGTISRGPENDNTTKIIAVQNIDRLPNDRAKTECILMALADENTKVRKEAEKMIASVEDPYLKDKLENLASLQIRLNTEFLGPEQEFNLGQKAKSIQDEVLETMMCK